MILHLFHQAVDSMETTEIPGSNNLLLVTVARYFSHLGSKWLKAVMIKENTNLFCPITDFDLSLYKLPLKGHPL